MEGGGWGGRRSVGGCGRPRTTLLDQMSSAVADGRDLAGLTLDDILAKEKRAVPAPPLAPAPPPVPAGRTLLDIIRDEDPKASTCKAYNGNRDKKCWKSFKERLRLKRSGAVWTSSVHIPTSDIIIPNNRSQFSRHNSVRRHTTAQYFADSPLHMSHPDDSSDIAAGDRDSRPQMSRRSSSRFTSHTSFRSDSAPDNHDDAFENSHGGSPAGPVPSLRPQMSRRISSRISPAVEENVADPTDPPREGSRRLSVVLAEERSLSAREAVAAQEAAEAEAAAAAIAAAEAEAEDSEWAPVPDTGVAPEIEAGQQVRMSLMDLLEETDRQMGFVGSRYTIGDAEEEGEEEEEEEEVVVVRGVDQNCCVCMVRHKGAAFIPCGHTFCRLCSRELWVSRGNCPLCNGFILEILDIF